MTTRRVFFLTSARSEYDLMSPVLEAARSHPVIKAAVVVAGAHLSPFHGASVRQIREDGFEVAGTLETLLASESWSARCLSFSHLTEGLTYLLSANRPDMLFVAGDREEALAGAVVASFLRIPVAHSHGGDRCIASDIDEVFRPAISKLAHIHFTATEGHRERLIRMGEPPALVFTAGAASLDRLRTEPDQSPDEVQRELGLRLDAPFFMVIQHSSPTLALERSGEEMTELLAGVLSLGHPVLCSYPNQDPGNIGIRQAIDAERAKNPLLRVYHNLDRRTFVTLYRRSAAMVGNSSSLLVEAGFLKVPGILVGVRQDLRDRGPHVLRVEPSRDEVRDACQRALSDPEFRATVAAAPSLYGDGYSAPRIVSRLAEVPLDGALLRKTMSY